MDEIKTQIDPEIMYRDFLPSYYIIRPAAGSESAGVIRSIVPEDLFDDLMFECHRDRYPEMIADGFSRSDVVLITGPTSVGKNVSVQHAANLMKVKCLHINGVEGDSYRSQCDSDPLGEFHTLYDLQLYKNDQSIVCVGDGSIWLDVEIANAIKDKSGWEGTFYGWELGDEEITTIAHLAAQSAYTDLITPVHQKGCKLAFCVPLRAAMNPSMRQAVRLYISELTRLIATDTAVVASSNEIPLFTIPYWKDEELTRLYDEEIVKVCMRDIKPLTLAMPFINIYPKELLIKAARHSPWLLRRFFFLLHEHMYRYEEWRSDIKIHPEKASATFDHKYTTLFDEIILSNDLDKYMDLFGSIGEFSDVQDDTWHVSLARAVRRFSYLEDNSPLFDHMLSASRRRVSVLSGLNIIDYLST